MTRFVTCLRTRHYPGNHGKVRGHRPMASLIALAGRAIQECVMGDVPSTSNPVSAWPGLTSFVGRRLDLETLAGYLREFRLVTLTGPGGVGKTRTARELAKRSRSSFPDGRHFVELASVTSQTQVSPAVATALGVADQSNRAAIDRVAGHLAGSTTLLILDNCEHLPDAAQQLVTGLLGKLPDLRVLTTSPEPLWIVGEQVSVLSPLAVPDEGDVARAGTLDHVPSVRLLADRARSVLPGFTVNDRNRGSVAQLCTQLDGLPLAIELAAMRLRSLSVSQIVERLDRRFHLLGGGVRGGHGRHRSLRALVGWGYGLCAPDEGLLWARLAGVPAAVDRDALRAGCGSGDLSADRLLVAIDGLVGKSVLVVRRNGRPVRYGQ